MLVRRSASVDRLPYIDRADEFKFRRDSIALVANALGLRLLAWDGGIAAEYPSHTVRPGEVARRLVVR